MAVVALDRLSKRYDRGHKPAVDDVSLTVAHGELMVFLGPSGCGKTTTLRMIAGLESISGGKLSIDDRVVNGVPAKDRDIAMVFQSYALYPHMTVAANLAFGLRRRGTDRAEIARRVRDVADALHLSGLLDRKPHALSGGQRQRVALGRAIVRDPKVFLFDEPLSNLDAALRASTRQEIAKLHRRLGATMIYVTHDQIEAMTLGDRICVMHEGRVAQIGQPLEVYRRPANVFVARFLGSPPMNVAPALVRVAADRVEAAIGGAWLQVPGHPVDAVGGPAGAGRAILFGVRPENLTVVDPSSDTPRALVQAVERLGAETVLTATLEDGAGRESEIAVRSPRDLRAEPGDRIGLRPDPHEIHLFDPDTGLACARRPS